jgi:hypothetical protein
MNPAVSRAMYDAPTTRVFPGFYFLQKISSDVIESSCAPGIYGYVGLPPVAIRIYLDVISSFSPSGVVNSI